MNNKEVIDEAIRRHQGKFLKPGTIVAHPDDPISKEFVRYEGDVAVTELDGVEFRFPASEIFGVKKVLYESILIKSTEIHPGAWKELS
jgi:hypothetical protein